MDYLTWKAKQSKRAKKWIKILLDSWFKVELSGRYQPAFNSVIIANSTSFIEVLIFCVFLPERLTIAFKPRHYNKFKIWILKLFADVIMIEPASIPAMKILIKAVRSGKRCLIFSQDLSIQQEHSLKVYDSLGFVLQKLETEVLPVYISRESRSGTGLNSAKNYFRLFPKITLHILAPHLFTSSKNQFLERTNLGTKIFRLISDLAFASNFQPRSLFTALIDGVYKGIKNKSTIEDSNRTPLTYRQFLVRCFILGRQIKKHTAIGEYVGVMMPTTSAGMVTFFALQAYRRIPAMINFSMGFYNLFSACTTSGIKTIYTSQQFVTTAKLETLVNELRDAGITICYLEEFKKSINLGHKVSALLKGMFPRLTYKLLGARVDPEQAGLVLFTSGSEGLPKGVALSHSNILANCYQMTSRVDFTNNDIFFNALPIFHCFGLTAGSMIPLINGMKCFFYPSPLHYKIIPGLVYQTGATIMFGTDTFLTGYARVAEKHDFRSVRYIFAGAEKVKPETIKYWSEVFGVTIYEGYGATEASPVISLNCPMASVPGSVGMILPAMESRIEAVEGIVEGGRLILRGPNIMLGYLNKDKLGSVNPPSDGWHDTGDIVTINEDGIITIAGRAKRFAKIAGEMISLTAVEGIAASIWPELLNAAVTKKCPKKGEQILLFSEASQADKITFVKKIREQGYSELLVPHCIYPSSEIPVLSSGKIDYFMLDKLLLTEQQTVEEF
jgi:acyl-[acyl-carrier-protein]-phospholipid O-acyltransferase/long-chain-fatty-acid--[acyl-carrier-protein] ligase